MKEPEDVRGAGALRCPSARPEWDKSVVLGVVVGEPGAPRVDYLVEPQPVTEELLALSGPVAPTEVFRFAAPCAGGACVHFDGTDCLLVGRITRSLPMVTERLPRCRLRPTCRWWRQEGREACMRCPQVVTDSYAPSPELRRAAEPERM